MLIVWLYAELSYVYVHTSLEISGLVLKDRYGRLPIADWYNPLSTTLLSPGSFTGFVFASTGVLTGLAQLIIKLLYIHKFTYKNISILLLIYVHS